MGHGGSLTVVDQTASVGGREYTSVCAQLRLMHCSGHPFPETQPGISFWHHHEKAYDMAGLGHLGVSHPSPIWLYSLLLSTDLTNVCQFDIFYVKYANIYAHMYKKTLKSFWRNRIKMKLKGQCCGASSQTATCNAGIPRKGRFKNKLLHFQSSSLVGEEKMPWCLGLRHPLGKLGYS